MLPSLHPFGQARNPGSELALSEAEGVNLE